VRSVYADAPASARYAGFWIRVLANALDVLWMGALNTAVWLIVFAGPRQLPPGVGSESAGIAEAIVESGILLPPLLVVGCWLAWGATPGKMVFGLRIIDESTGGRPTVWQCIGRYVMALVSIACVGLGYLWIVIDPRRQGWHDKIVRTLVIRRQ
jgi:uncharacterized RDD family membrane protein YckC